MASPNPKPSRRTVREPTGTGEASAWWHAWRPGRPLAWTVLILVMAALAWCAWTALR